MGRVALCHSRAGGNPIAGSMPSTLLALLQFFFALTWVVYVIYLPALAADVGIDRRYVPMILMMDQVIFLACDWAAGMYADRVARTFGRIGGTMAIATLVSCGAFILLPLIAPWASKSLFLFLTILWSVTSSALRAPPFAIVSRHANAASQPWVACSYLFGLGLASALAPYIAIDLRQLDPRIPFALSSVGLALFALALARAELTHATGPSTEFAASTSAPARPPILLFAVVLLLLAFGYQVHFAINSSPSYLRFANKEDLPLLMPVFWIGFNIALVPATLLAKRFSGAAVMVGASVAGVAALAACAYAPSLTLLVVAQGFAGAAWCIVMTSAFTAALEAGKPGREGLFTGTLFSMLAAAALARLAIITYEISSGANIPAQQLDIVPFMAWALAAFLVAAIAFPDRKKA